MPAQPRRGRQAQGPKRTVSEPNSALFHVIAATQLMSQAFADVALSHEQGTIREDVRTGFESNSCVAMMSEDTVDALGWPLTLIWSGVVMLLASYFGHTEAQGWSLVGVFHCTGVAGAHPLPHLLKCREAVGCF